MRNVSSRARVRHRRPPESAGSRGGSRPLRQGAPPAVVGPPMLPAATRAGHPPIASSGAPIRIAEGLGAAERAGRAARSRPAPGAALICAHPPLAAPPTMLGNPGAPSSGRTPHRRDRRPATETGGGQLAAPGPSHPNRPNPISIADPDNNPQDRLRRRPAPGRPSPQNQKGIIR